MKDWKKQIVEARLEGEYVVFYSSTEELLRVKEAFVDSLEDWFTKLYKIKCETMAQQLRTTADLLEKEV